MNNRKLKEKENNQQSNNIKCIEPLQPKFIPNWSSVVRFQKIVVNISDCVYDVLPKVCKQLKFKVQKDKQNAQWDLWWTDWHVLPQTLMKMEHHQKINHFPGMHVLSRKNLMAKNLMKMRKKSVQQYNFFPLTWNLPLDYNQFKAYFDTKPKGKARTYIVKPESMSQGKGIFLTRKIEDIDRSQHCVVQRYISKPYLIDGLKFDLRIYVLVASVDPLEVYIYKEGLARFATEQYIMPNKDNMQDVCMHLTNYAINKDSQKFVFNSDQNDMSIGHKRSLTSAFQTLEKNGIDIQALNSKIHQIIVKTLISGLSHLKFQYRSCQPQNYRSDMCFQILGFDIILNQSGDPFLLEINYTPSFSTDTPLDLTIKKNLIKDTMTLVQLQKQIKQKTVKQRVQVKNQRMMTGKKGKFTPEEKQIKKSEALKFKKIWVDQHIGGYTRICPLEENSPQQLIYQEMIKFQSDYESGGLKKTKKQVFSNNNIPPPTHSTPSHMNRSRNSQKLSKLPQISSSKQNTIRKFSASKLNSQKRIIEINKTSGFSNSDKILKDLPDSDINDLELRHSPYEEKSSASNQKIGNSSMNSLKNRDFLNLQHKLSVEDRDVILQQNSQKFIKKMKLREIYPKKRIQQRETLVPKPIQFQGNKYDGLSEGYIIGRGLGRGQ